MGNTLEEAGDLGGPSWEENSSSGGDVGGMVGGVVNGGGASETIVPLDRAVYEDEVGASSGGDDVGDDDDAYDDESEVEDASYLGAQSLWTVGPILYWKAEEA